MKNLIYFVILVFGANLLNSAAQEDKAIEPIQKWSGENVDNKRLKPVPKDGFSKIGVIVNKAGWLKLWQAWRTDEIPKIDFTKYLIVFCTTQTPNNCYSNIKLSPSGNLKFNALSTLIGSTDKTFNYSIVLIDRAGIKSIKGKSIASSN